MLMADSYADGEKSMKLHAKKRWHNLLVAALADQQITPEEKDYLESLRLELGISEADSTSGTERGA